MAAKKSGQRSRSEAPQVRAGAPRRALKERAPAKTSRRTGDQPAPASARAEKPARSRTGAAKRRLKASEVGAKVPLSELPTDEEYVTTKHASKGAQRGGARSGRAKSTRVANPKRSDTLQASKRANARRVDGRLAR